MPDSLFTIIAQIVNFLIIVVVLRALLFKRILGAVEERQRKIKEQREEIAEEEAKAKKTRQELEEKHADFRKEREKMMQHASDEAAKRRRRLIEEAESEAEKKRSRWETSMEKERDSFLAELRALAADDLLNLAERMLTDLADDSLERRIARRVIERLRDGGELAEEIRTADTVTVLSSYGLPDEIKEQLRELLPAADFSRSDDFHGLAIEAGGRRIAWTVEGWLDEFGAELERRLAEYGHEAA